MAVQPEAREDIWRRYYARPRTRETTRRIAQDHGITPHSVPRIARQEEAWRTLQRKLKPTYEKAPEDGTQPGRDPLEADRTNCQFDDTGSTTETEEGI